MALIMEESMAAFDLSQVRKGCLFWGKHATWEEGKAGFVTAATKERLTVQYDPGIGNVTNHFYVPVSEAAAGEWEIRWSFDLSKVWECGISEEETDAPEGAQEECWNALQGEGDLDESGRADL